MGSNIGQLKHNFEPEALNFIAVGGMEFCFSNGQEKIS